MRGKSLNTIVYRGFTKASDLARISEPDIFDQEKNPQGTQRDLKEWHARQAHAYAAGNITRETKQRIWPEVLLNIRDLTVVKVGDPMENELVIIEIFEDKIESRNGINPQISRVDGNHRLFYAKGFIDEKKKLELSSIDIMIPFSLTIGLDRKEEAALFSDINSNVLKMNTSHLDHLRYRLIGEEIIKKEELSLWIAEDLSLDPDSPFYNLIYLGGKRPKKYLLTLRTFKEGIETLLKESQELTTNKIPYDLKSKAIKTFWRSVKNTFLEEWTERLEKSRANLLLSYFAYFAWSKLGAVIIDRSLRRENPTLDEMQSQLVNIKKKIDWSNEGIFKGFGGKGGGDIAFEEMKKWLPIEYKLEEALKKLKEVT